MGGGSNMSGVSKRMSLAGLAAVSILLCDLAAAKQLLPVRSEGASGQGLEIKVRDELSALAQAHVWVETRDGKVLSEGETDRDGRFALDAAVVSDSALKEGLSVTAASPGHAAVSFLENVAHRVSLELPKHNPDSYGTLKGKLTGFGEPEDESRAMLGVVAKGLEVTDLMQMESSSFVSPLKDSIDLFGRREIPSNIVLPDQTIPVYFMPVRINKPVYRLPILAGSSSRYFGVAGTVNVQQAISALRGGNSWDIVNLLEFDKVGLSQEVKATEAGKEIPLSFAADKQIRESVRLRPGRNTTPADSRRLAVALWEAQPGLFVPTDVKLVQNEPLALTAIQASTARVMDVLLNKEGDHYRGGWLSPAQTAFPEAGLTAGLSVNGLEGTWAVRGGETAQLMVGHVESFRSSSVGNARYEDQWVVVSPRKAQLRLPAGAVRGLRGQLGKVSHVSVDLLQMGQTSYPFLSGESSAGDLSVFEKIRKEVKN